jgi:exopolysaccharide production protein ExoF
MNRLLTAAAVLIVLPGLFCGISVAADPDTKSEVIASPVRDNLAIGDRLKVTVFEIMSGQNQTEAWANSLVERLELSGEYTVERDGSLSISFVGPIQATGKTQLQIEKLLEESYPRLMGIKAKVTIRLLEREPIYITGSGMKPGYVKFTPGMIALQAIALAGGLDRSADWARIDLARERERLLKSREKARVLHARLRILLTERGEKLPEGDIDATILTNELALRTSEQQRHNAQVDALSTALEMTTHELILLRERLMSAESSVEQKTEYLKTIEAAHAKGLVNEATYHQVKSDVNIARERWLEVKTAIAQTERKAFELGQEKNRFIVENDIKRQTEIKELSAALVDDAATQRSVGAILQDFGELPLRASNNTNQIIITLLRQGASGREQISADMLTNLQPGDILQLGTGNRT